MTRLAVDVRALAADNLTGVGVYERDLLQAMLQLDPELELRLWTAGSQAPKMTHLQPLLQRQQDQTVHFYQSNRYFNLTTVLGSAGKQLYRQLQADCHFFPHPNFLPLPVPQPYAVTVHDLSFLHQPSWYDFKGRLWHRALHLRELLTSARAIIAVSESTAEQIQHYFPHIAGSKIRVIPNGLKTQLLTREQAQTLTASLQLPPDFVLSVGTIEPRKNLASVIAAYQRWRHTQPAVKLVIAGKYGWSVVRSQLTQREKEGIIWLGFVSDEQRNALYRLARAFVWPSFYEGFGFPPLEALRQGTPVVTSYTSAMPEMLQQYAYYVNPYNYGELAQIVGQILVQPNRLVVPEAFFDTFSWHAAAKETLDVLLHV